MESTHVDAVPAQSPDQPPNFEVEDGVSVSVTEVPLPNCAVQTGPQVSPDGELVTVPAPAPPLKTFRVRYAGGGGGGGGAGGAAGGVQTVSIPM